MRAKFYDLSSLMMMGVAIYFFFRSVSFLTDNNYVSGVMTMLIGFMIIRASVDLSRVAIASEREESAANS